MSAPDSTPAQRLRMALDLYEAGEALMRARLQREHPEWTAIDLDEAIRSWLQDRPGAEFGDYPGPASARIIGAAR